MAITHDLRNVHLRFEDELLEWLKQDAAESYRSLPKQIRWIIVQYRESKTQEASK